jgi:DNA-binding NarL/FixJ family response regulator
MARKHIKRDIWNRRTDRVKTREVDRMLFLRQQGLTTEEIAKKLQRKPQTVKRHVEAACQLCEENRLTEK